MGIKTEKELYENVLTEYRQLLISGKTRIQCYEILGAKYYKAPMTIKAIVGIQTKREGDQS